MKNIRFIAFALLISVFPLAFAPTAQAAPPGPTITEVVISNPDIDNDGEGDFDTLLVAVLAADPAVLSTLSGNGQFTVFAPTDDAFAAAFAELATLGITPEDVLSDTEFLTDILLYHVARGNRNSKSVLGSNRIRTLERSFLFQDSGTLTDTLGRDANLIATDVPASNGVIHVIDNVVLPYLP